MNEQRLKEIEQIYDLNIIKNPEFAKYVRELIGGCRELDKEVMDWRMRFEVAFENNIQYINENKRLNEELKGWMEETLTQARLYTEKNEKAHNWQSQAKKLFETIETAISELEFLERSLNLPDRGYDRNNFNRVMRTLKDGVSNGT